MSIWKCPKCGFTKDVAGKVILPGIGFIDDRQKNAKTDGVFLCMRCYFTFLQEHLPAMKLVKENPHEKN